MSKELMRAAVYVGARRFEIRELPVPIPAPGNVLVKVRYCGICGTDVHTFMYDVTPPGSQLGHEYSGSIVSIGEGVDQWEVGDRIICGGGLPPNDYIDPFGSDPRSNYRLHAPALLAGTEWARGYAEYVEMEAWRPISIPQGVSDEAAAMAEPLATAVHAVRKSALKVGDTVAIIGAGPIGLFTMQVARAAGASTVLVAEPAPTRSKAALDLGADSVVDPTETDVEEALVELTAGIGPDVVFECAAAKGTLNDALRTVRRGGNAVLVSLAFEEEGLNPVDWIAREINFTTSFTYETADWHIGLDLISKEKVRVEPLMTKDAIIGLDSLQATFERLMAPASDIKVLLDPSK